MATGESALGAGASGPNWDALQANLSARLASRFVQSLSGDDAARQAFADELAADALAAMQAGKPHLVEELAAQARARGERLRLTGADSAWMQVASMIGDLSQVGLELAPLLL